MISPDMRDIWRACAWVAVMIAALLLLGEMAFAASATTQLNITSDGENLTVQAPSGTFQTIVGMPFTRTFDITNTYDQTLIYNSTMVVNYTCDESEQEYAIFQNITDGNRSISFFEWQNETRTACLLAQATCANLTNSTITHSFNITSDSVVADINRSNQEVMDYLSRELLPDKGICDNYKTELERCQGVYLENCHQELNMTQYMLKREGEDKTYAIVFVLILVGALIILLTVMLGRNFLKKQTMGPTSLREQGGA